jgi:hypothetical protein
MPQVISKIPVWNKKKTQDTLNASTFFSSEFLSRYVVDHFCMVCNATANEHSYSN